LWEAVKFASIHRAFDTKQISHEGKSDPKCQRMVILFIFASKGENQMKKIVGMLSIFILVFSVAAFAQSAKFAAVYSEEPVIAESEAEASSVLGESDFGWGIDLHGAVLLASMKMPQGKEILAGISTESLILLETYVKGKNGGSGIAAGYGRVEANVFAFNTDTHHFYRPVPNGRIIFNARYQQLNATLGGVIESCADTNEDGTIDVATECTVEPEEIGLLTKNESANHFNVVFVDLPQGNYKIYAFFTVLSTSVAGTEDEAEAYAHSKVILGDRIVTLQEVRAVKDAIVPIDWIF